MARIEAFLEHAWTVSQVATTDILSLPLSLLSVFPVRVDLTAIGALNPAHYVRKVSINLTPVSRFVTRVRKVTIASSEALCQQNATRATIALRGRALAQAVDSVPMLIARACRLALHAPLEHTKIK